MVPSRSIYVVHAGDADLHLGSLRNILSELKSENRIADYFILESDSVSADSFNIIRAREMVILLLTDSLLTQRPTITGMLAEVRNKEPDVKIAEVIIDNIPYDLEFIAFPTDLVPIRSRKDMDGVWARIRQILSDFFPQPAEEPAPAIVPGKKSRWTRLKEKPHVLCWISIPVIIILGLIGILIQNNSGGYVNHDMFEAMVYLSIIFGIMAIVYWVLLRFKRQISKKWHVIQLMLTFGIFLLSIILTTLPDLQELALSLLFIVQIIFPINLIYGIVGKKGPGKLTDMPGRIQ